MDQVNGDDAPHERIERIASALGTGIILVSAGGEIKWVDEKTKARVDGQLRELTLPIRKWSSPSIDCFVSTVDLEVGGKPIRLCVIQETEERRDSGNELFGAIESIMSDSSWITRTIIDKLKAWRFAKRPPAAADLNSLTEREREILALICDGRSTLEISRTLGVSQNTVRNHIASLYRKIGVNRRSAAIIWARERAITKDDIFAHRTARRIRAGPPDG